MELIDPTSSLASQATCPVCLELIDTVAHEATCCGRLACAVCAGKLATRPNCFNCRKPLGTEFRFQKSLFATRLLQQEQVRCKSCAGVMTMAEWRKHVKITDRDWVDTFPCPHVRRKCVHENCEFEGNLAEMKHHVARECSEGYRALDAEAWRLCGGAEGLRKSMFTIQRVLKKIDPTKAIEEVPALAAKLCDVKIYPVQKYRTRTNRITANVFISAAKDYVDHLPNGCIFTSYVELEQAPFSGPLFTLLTRRKQVREAVQINPQENHVADHVDEDGAAYGVLKQQQEVKPQGEGEGEQTTTKTNKVPISTTADLIRTVREWDRVLSKWPKLPGELNPLQDFQVRNAYITVVKLCVVDDYNLLPFADRPKPQEIIRESRMQSRHSNLLGRIDSNDFSPCFQQAKEAWKQAGFELGGGEEEEAGKRKSLKRGHQGKTNDNTLPSTCTSSPSTGTITNRSRSPRQNRRTRSDTKNTASTTSSKNSVNINQPSSRWSCSSSSSVGTENERAQGLLHYPLTQTQSNGRPSLVPLPKHFRPPGSLQKPRPKVERRSSSQGGLFGEERTSSAHNEHGTIMASSWGSHHPRLSDCDLAQRIEALERKTSRMIMSAPPEGTTSTSCSSMLPAEASRVAQHATRSSFTRNKNSSTTTSSASSSARPAAQAEHDARSQQPRPVLNLNYKPISRAVRS
ncbi:unnamed protein product [Amoebophrya sp. A120]|nr:unnamed protein product [Amoebophrya sp. A120]|eukprot:GSA120T00000076001.1